MEQLMESIIRADKQAHEIINVAKKEREHIKQRAIEEAKRDLKLRQTAQQKQIKQQDTQLIGEQEQLMRITYEEYIGAKHKLDELFNLSADAWSEEIVNNVINNY